MNVRRNPPIDPEAPESPDLEPSDEPIGLDEPYTALPEATPSGGTPAEERSVEVSDMAREAMLEATASGIAQRSHGIRPGQASAFSEVVTPGPEASERPERGDELEVTASQILSQPVVTVDQETTAREAIEILQSMDVRHLPVIGKQGELIGMLSDRDLAPVQAKLDPRDDSDQGPQVAEIMTPDAIAVDPEAGLVEISDLMVEHRIGALPVIEPATQEVIGIVSYVDVLRVVRDARSE